MNLGAKKAPSVGMVVLCVVALLAVSGTFDQDQRKTLGLGSNATPAALTEIRPGLAQPQDRKTATLPSDITPPRQIVGLHWVKNGWTYNCMECHKVLTARWHYDQPPNEHKTIRLEHGNNRFCLNCHHPTNRNAFVDYDGSEIAETDVVQLCAKCHGTIYRDWNVGVHGRENGFWKASLGTKTKLRCIQCHDPHSPTFKPLAPLAPLRYPPRGAHPPKIAHAASSTHLTGP